MNNFLFFDIECANCFGGRGKICSFGYVLTNAAFEVLAREDLIINPDAEFYLAGRKNTPDIELAYTKQQFADAPKFPFYYEKIKALLEAPDQIVIGHSVANDVGFLMSDCRRYGLQCFCFRFCDTQKIYSALFDVAQQISLATLASKYGVEKEDKHKSDDDAYLTMLGLSGMCRECAVTLPEILASHPHVCGDIDSFQVKYGNRISKNGVSVRQWKLRLRSFLWHIKPVKHVTEIEGIAGKNVSFSSDVEKNDYQKTFYLIQSVINAGGRYEPRLAKCNLFVYDENEKSSRIDKIDEFIAQGARIKRVTYAQFLEMLRLERDWETKADDVRYEYLDTERDSTKYAGKLHSSSTNIGDVIGKATAALSNKSKTDRK